MGINYIKTNVFIGHVGTLRTLTITTAAPQVHVATTGTIYVMLQNNGSGNIAIGDSATVTNYGDIVFPYGNREYYPVSDGFFIYLQAISVASTVSWTDYYTG